jgi:hypothetical protein
MEVIITEWGLQSYVSLKGQSIFSDSDYKLILRPDVELLKVDDPFDPNHPKFNNSKFWGPATYAGYFLKFGYKMKWHNLGPGKVQLRLCIVIVESELEGVLKTRTFLCTSYVKNDKSEKREMAKLKVKIQKIFDGTYLYRGKL